MDFCVIQLETVFCGLCMEVFYHYSGPLRLVGMNDSGRVPSESLLDERKLTSTRLQLKSPHPPKQ